MPGPRPIDRRRTWAAIGLAAALLVAAVAVPSIGASSSPSEKAARAIRLAHAADRRSNRVLDAITSSIPGAQGNPGAKGPKGPKGPKGADGKAGLPGINGAAGAAGEAGLPGADGAAGPDGHPGGTLVARARGTSDQTPGTEGGGNYPLNVDPSWTALPGEIDALIVQVAWTDNSCDTGGLGDAQLSVSTGVTDNTQTGFATIDVDLESSPTTLAPIFLAPPSVATDRTVSLQFGTNCDTGSITVNGASVDVGALRPAL